VYSSAADRPHPGNSLPAIALLWLGGTLLLHQLPALPALFWYPLLLIGAALCTRFRHTRLLVWFIAGFSLTGMVAEIRLADRLPPALVGEDLHVRGWVDGFPDHNGESLRFSFRVTSSEIEGLPRRLRLNWYEPQRSLSPGDALDIVVRLRRPRGMMNPGGFDYERWLFLEGFGATGYVRSGDLADDPSFSLPRRWLRLRHALAERLQHAGGDGDGVALLTALSLGERSGFTDQHWTILRRTGTSHLVAISGMHVGLIAALVFLLVRRLWLRMPGALAHRDLEAAAAAAVVAAIVYAALAGFAIPTQRALVMVGVALAITVSRRHTGLFQGLAAALLAVIVPDPLAPLSASFWMSFFAVFLLLMMASSRPLVSASGPKHERAPRNEAGGRSAAGARVMPRTGNDTMRRALTARVVQLATLQWNISLGLTPLVALYFSEVSLVSPVVNFVAIPFFSLLLVPGTLLAALVVSLSDLAGGLLVQAMTVLAELTWWALERCAAIPWAAVELTQARVAVQVLVVVAVLLAMPAHAFHGRRWLWLVLFVLALPPSTTRPAHGEASAVVLDVGHGLAVLVQTANHSVLYDAGPRYRSGFDSGAEVVVPAIRALNAPPPDTVIISHDHNDHTGGVAAVLEAFPDARVIRGPDVEQPAGDICFTGMTWHVDDVEFLILHPSENFFWRGNESSCLLKVTASGVSLLITGDMEGHAERAVIDDPRLVSDVVVVGHHGSRTSSSPAFVTGTSPRYALISVDYYSRWGFPSPEVRQRWTEAGARVLVTGESGALHVTMNAGGVEVHPQRLHRTRYWHADTRPLSGASGPSAL
jgi:competence protein ComEC